MQGHALCRRLCICVPRASSIAARIPIGFQGDALRLETPTAAVGVQSVARASGVVPIFAPGKPVNRGDRLILRGDHLLPLELPAYGDSRWLGTSPRGRGRRARGLGPARAPRVLAGASRCRRRACKGSPRVQLTLTRNRTWGGVPFLEAATGNGPIGRGVKPPCEATSTKKRGVGRRVGVVTGSQPWRGPPIDPRQPKSRLDPVGHRCRQQGMASGRIPRPQRLQPCYISTSTYRCSTVTGKVSAT